VGTIRHSAIAENDLLETWLYIAEYSVDAADQLLDQIDTETRMLLIQPRIGRTRDELAEGMRSWTTSTPYILFYFVDDSGITIARVLHHARDVPSIVGWPRH
jgi:plasmid stabilization system protein ParE